MTFVLPSVLVSFVAAKRDIFVLEKANIYGHVMMYLREKENNIPSSTPGEAIMRLFVYRFPQLQLPWPLFQMVDRD